MRYGFLVFYPSLEAIVYEQLWNAVLHSCDLLTWFCFSSNRAIRSLEHETEKEMVLLES